MNSTSSPNTPIFILHAATGILQVTTNFIIVFVCCRFWAMRHSKEYIILVGLALADGLDGIPSWYSGTYRLILGDAIGLNATRTPLQCMLYGLHNPMWAFTDTAQSMMMTAVSFDRVLAVVIPLRYFSFGPRYGYIVVGSVYFYCLISACTAWIYPITKAFDPNATLIQAYCYVPGAVGPIFNVYYGNIRTIVSWGSIVLYVLVIVLFARYVRQSAALSGPNQLKFALQRKLTITLSFQCLATFVLYIIPTMVVSLDNVATSSLNSYILVVTNFNAIINLFIYWVRQKEFRIATVCAFTGKSLPAIMSNWEMPHTHSIRGSEHRVHPRQRSPTWTK